MLGLGIAWANPIGAEPPADPEAERATLDDIMDLVRNNYVEEIPPDVLLDGRSGLLRRLDPHSNYVDAKRYEQMSERNRGETTDRHLVRVERGNLTVITAIEGSPSDRLGVRAGDRIEDRRRICRRTLRASGARSAAARTAPWSGCRSSARGLTTCSR